VHFFVVANGLKSWNFMGSRRSAIVGCRVGGIQ